MAPNGSIPTLTKKNAKFTFTGPILIISQSTTLHDPFAYQDFQLIDLRAFVVILDFCDPVRRLCVWWLTSTPISYYMSMRSYLQDFPGMVPGVLFWSKSNQKLKSEHKYSPIQVPSTDGSVDHNMLRYISWLFFIGPNIYSKPATIQKLEICQIYCQYR
jgi:hypothetical protein